MRPVRVARVYASLRTAHLERFAVMAPAAVFYHRSRYDYDESVLPAGRPKPSRTSRAGVLRALVAGRFDVVETNEPLMTRRWPDLLAQLAVVRLIPRRRADAVAYCIGVTDPAEELAARLPAPLARLTTRLVLGLLVRGYRRLAFGTDASYELVARYVPRRVLASRSRVVPALPTVCDCPLPAERDDAFDVLFVGAFAERKGVRQLLAGWDALPSGHGRRLHLIGTGPLLDDVLAWAASRPEVTVEVDPPREQVHRALRRARVLVLLSQRLGSWREQVGLPVVEALAHGCEVITTTETGLATWLAAHGHRVLPPDAPAEAVAEALLACTAEPRPRPLVLADLPATDGRIAADRWLLTGDSEEGDVTAPPAPVTVVFATGKGPEAWARRHAQSPVPGRWPYGLDLLAGTGLAVSAAELPASGTAGRLVQRVTGGRIRGLGGPLRLAGTALCWEEQTATRARGRIRADRMLSGVIWVTDRLHDPTAADEVARIRRALLELDGLWVLSRPQVEVVRDWLGEGAPPVSFVRFGVDPEFYAAASYERAEPLVVSIGGDRDRDPVTLLAALEQVRRRRPDVRAVVQSSWKGPVPDGVEVHEHLPHAEVASLYARAAVVAVATRPNVHVSGMTVALEAMSTARPVVVCDTPGMTDYVHDATGRVVPVADSHAMAEQILDLMEDPTTAARLGAAGRAAVEERFTSATMCREIAALLP